MSFDRTHHPEGSFARFNLTGTVAVAVSGGADSMALTKLVIEAYPHVVAVTVDHQLRPESRAEAEQVGRWMSDWGVEHTVLTWQEPSTKRLQERARQARYNLMGQWCKEMGIETLMTAHHQDDVIETFWMRTFKGSGPVGLCGMASERMMPFGRLIRPLLSIPRDQLRQVLGDHPYINDPSNDNSRFERVRCRQWLQENPDQREAAVRAMLQFQQTEAYIQGHVKQALETYVCHRTFQMKPHWQELPHLISQRIWQLLVRKVGGADYPMSYDLCVRVDASLRKGKSITAGGVWFRPINGGVILQREVARRRA